MAPYLALGAAMLLTWASTLTAMFRDQVYTVDLSKVALANVCINGSLQTFFATSLIAVALACKLLQSYVMPRLLFGQGGSAAETAWDSFSDVKRRKMVGNLTKIFVRCSALVQLCMFVSPYPDLSQGLFSSPGGIFEHAQGHLAVHGPHGQVLEYQHEDREPHSQRHRDEAEDSEARPKFLNVKQAASEMSLHGHLLTCADAGLTPADASALRSWFIARGDLMAVMLWELMYLPELSLDIWMHHLILAVFVITGTDPHTSLIGIGDAKLQPFSDAIAYFLVLGACLTSSVEAMVLRYHLLGTLKGQLPASVVLRKQATAMWLAFLSQALIIAMLFTGMPFYVLVRNWEHFAGEHGETWWLGVLAVLALLVFEGVEVYVVQIKWRVVRATRKKAVAATSAEASTDRCPAVEALGAP